MTTGHTGNILAAALVAGSASCARDPAGDTTLVLLVAAAIVALVWWRGASSTTAVAVSAGLTAALSSHTAVAAPGATGGPDVAPMVARARAAAEAEGFTHTETVQAGGAAAIVRYRGTSIPRGARVDFVGASGAPVTVEDSMIALPPAPGGATLWDLHGDGARFAVLEMTACGANCSPLRYRTLELRGNAWTVPVAQLERPAERTDVDMDGVPDFPGTLAHLVIAGCSRVRCGPTYHIGVTVTGPESWDGKTYTRDLRSFRPEYARRLAAARTDAAAHRARKGQSDPCPVAELQTASEIYVYSRILGVAEVAAARAADAVMAGRTTSTCGDGYHDLRDWPELRRELGAVKLPELTRERPAR